jgi:hypothetical protein
MTFDAYETSIGQGEPVLLFDFSAGLAHWRYTTADRPIVYAAQSYAPAAITAGNIKQNHEIKNKTLLVSVPRDTLIVERLQVYPPSVDLGLVVLEFHYDDPDVQAIVVWIGRVSSQNQKQSTVELACEPAYTGIQTAGLRRRWQLNCPHVLYGPNTCRLTTVSQRITAVLTGVAGFGITSPTFATLGAGKSFAGGFVEWDSGFGYNEKRTINSVTGTTLILAYSSPDLAVGLSVNAYPGCKHTLTDCHTLQGHTLNYGGAPYIPTKNPLTGNPVY